MHSQTEQVYQQVLARDPGEREFQQAVYTFLLSIDKVIEELPEITYHRVLGRAGKGRHVPCPMGG